MRKILFITTLLLSLGAQAQSDDFVTLIYSGDILNIPVKTGVETRLVLDFDASIGYHPSAATKGVQTNILPSGIFITVNNPFESDYAEIAESGGSGQIIPVRFISNDNVANAPTKYKIVNNTIEKTPPATEVDVVAENRAVVRNVLPSTSGASEQNNNTIVDMLRFTANSLFGAPRHRTNLSGIKSVITMEDSYRLIPGGRAKTSVISSYEYKGLYITAVKVTNRSKREFDIDPRSIVGHWMYAGIQAGTKLGGRESGVIYLVSSVPFDEAIRKVVNWRKL